MAVETEVQKKIVKISSDTLRQLCLEEGADDAGFVEVDRPALSGDREGIRRLFPRARTLISLVGKMNRDALRTPARYVANQEFHHTIHDLTAVARSIVRRLEAMGIRAVAPTVGFPMDMDRLGDFKIWDVSHKLVAEQAGLGAMGLHRNVIHPKIGNYLLLETILIDVEVDRVGEPLEYNPCLTCNLCVSACPVGAVHRDGSFDFNACMTHNYREFFGGFQDWMEQVADSSNARDYRHRVSDSETASMWQSLSFGANYKAAYCMAVCPAGEEIYSEYEHRTRDYVQEVVRPLKEKPEPIYVQAHSPAEEAALKQPNKTIRHVHNRLRPQSIGSFIRGLPIAFNAVAARGLNFSVQFAFTGEVSQTATVSIQEGQLTIAGSHDRKNPDLEVAVDSRVWIDILNQRMSPLRAIFTRKIKWRGNLMNLLKFQKCFPV